jgi:hypothetical protein
MLLMLYAVLLVSAVLFDLYTPYVVSILIINTRIGGGCNSVGSQMQQEFDAW